MEAGNEYVVVTACGQVLHDFPLEMQGDVAIHLHREVLSLPIFDNASQGCRKAIAMQIAPTFCTPGEYVLHRGDAINCIYCVCNGSMEVLRDSMVVAILGMLYFPNYWLYNFFHRVLMVILKFLFRSLVTQKNALLKMLDGTGTKNVVILAHLMR